MSGTRLTRRELHRGAAGAAGVGAMGVIAACGSATGTPTRAERRAVTVQYWSRWGGANNTDKVDVTRLPEFDQKMSPTKVERTP